MITDIELTRGVDYRAAPGVKGIALLVMSPMPSDRALIQLLGRVGRFFEESRRFKCSKLRETVAKAKVTQLSNALATKRN